MKFTWLKWGVVPVAVLLSAMGGSVVRGQDQSSSPASSATPAQGSSSSATPTPAPAPAHYGNNKIAQRREHQQARIAQGVKSGELTPKEAAKLDAQQKAIHKQAAAERKANGGKLTAAQRKQINKEQSQASRNIYRKKHNAAKQSDAKPQS